MYPCAEAISPGLGSHLNARLGDFCASGYPGHKGLGIKSASYFLPRSPDELNTSVSYLFALGSTVYELRVGESPYCGLEDDAIETLYAKEDSLSLLAFVCGCIVTSCWRCEFPSVEHVSLQFGEVFSKD
jgi:hypothetical protein